MTAEDPEEDARFMRVALGEAERAATHGDVPVGALVVGPGGEELGRGENRREIDHDPTAHAEVVAIRKAAARRGHFRLDGCTVYATLEPCPMCAGALVNARVSRLVFGATDPKAGAVVTLYDIGRTEKLNHRMEVRGGVLAESSVLLLQRFFGELRARGEK